jgi:hypothetical protein
MLFLLTKSAVPVSPASTFSRELQTFSVGLAVWASKSNEADVGRGRDLSSVG